MMERETIAAQSVAGEKAAEPDATAFEKAASTEESFAEDVGEAEVLRTADPRPPTLLNYLHSLIAIPLIYLYTIIMGSISLTLSLYDPGGRRQHWCARVWCRLIARTAGARVRVHGAEHIK